jgi:polyhydroxyalkanoate synthase
MLKNQGIKANIDNLDTFVQNWSAKMAGGLSPIAINLAVLDWYSNLLLQPSKQIDLKIKFDKTLLDCAASFYDSLSMTHNESDRDSLQPALTDRRFANEAWQQFPFNFISQSFLLQKQWLQELADVKGANPHNLNIVEFLFRQITDSLSPSNGLLTNPEILQATIHEKGDNLVRGYQNFTEDLRRQQANIPPVGTENFVLGKNIAVTPGKVVLRNRLIELIQYQPTTDKVYQEPILITPAWIMKYYILDLEPKNSLVKFLVSQGHTVFMISWKNPDASDAELGMEDYLNLGILAALDTIEKIVPKTKIHLAGYCLGGTLAAIASATLARDNPNRLATTTLLAAQTDFSEPGELGLFIDENQLSALDKTMQQQGFLDGNQMGGAFALLRANDLLWGKYIQEYCLGERKPLNDLMAWNADATRMPYQMHSQYLRRLFLNNDLANGRYQVAHQPIALSAIKTPIFVVATETDHVSPWRSVYKITSLAHTKISFVLTSGGHNVGIVNPPIKESKRHYRFADFNSSSKSIDPTKWYTDTKTQKGSWWPHFSQWLAQHSGPKQTPPKIGGSKASGIKGLAPAPGTYVQQR